MAYNNMGGQVYPGYFSRLDYDSKTYDDKLFDSTAPLSFRVNQDNNYNCNACLSVFGPRPSQGARSYGVSSIAPLTSTAPAQDLTDIESILTLRNVPQSKDKVGRVSNIDLSKFRINHPRICNSVLDPLATHLTDPPGNFKEVPINRFYDLYKDPQQNIFYDFAINTKLEAKDNFTVKVPKLWSDDRLLPPGRFQC